VGAVVEPVVVSTDVAGAVDDVSGVRREATATGSEGELQPVASASDTSTNDTSTSAQVRVRRALRN